MNRFECLFPSKREKFLTLDRLKILEAVDRAGSLIDAAGGDPVRAAWYSKEISRLEGYFEYPLVTRDENKIVTNEDGEQLARLVRDLQRGLVGAVSQKRRGWRIGAGESLLHWIVTPRLASVASVFPE